MTKILWIIKELRSSSTRMELNVYIKIEILTDERFSAAFSVSLILLLTPSSMTEFVSFMLSSINFSVIKYLDQTSLVSVLSFLLLLIVLSRPPLSAVQQQ